MEQPILTGNEYPTPPGSVSDIGSHTDATSVASSNANAGLHDLKPYNEYLIPAKRTQLALKEFELQMATRELSLKETDEKLQRFTGPRLRTYTLPYVLTDSQLELAKKRFPRTRFACSLDANHDHPLAHLETMIGTDQVARLFPAGSYVIDMWGSPKKCAELNRQQQRSNNPKTFFPYVSIMSEKDNIRALSWEGLPHFEGPTGRPLEDLDVANRGTIRHDTGKACDFMFIHTLYYISDDDLAQLLAVKGSRAIALVHRHKGDSGSMFDGEARFAKIGHTVEQVNSMTGERYTHRDVSFLFDSKSKVVHTPRGNFTWTLHKVTEETWIIVLVGCESRDERFINRTKTVGIAAASHEMNTAAVTPSHFPHPLLEVLPKANCVMVGHVPVITLASGYPSPIKVSCPEMLEFLMGRMVGKPRNALTLQDLFALARTHLRDGTSFAGKIGFSVQASEIAGHVVLAFVSGVKEETDLLESLTLYQHTVREHTALLNMSAVVAGTGKLTLVQTGVSVAKRINVARKAGDTFDAILDVLHD